MGNKPRGFSALVFDLFFLSLPPSLNLVDCKNRLVLIQNKIIYGAPSRKSPGRFHHTHVCMQAGMRSRCTHNTHTHTHAYKHMHTHTHSHSHIHSHTQHARMHTCTHTRSTHTEDQNGWMPWLWMDVVISISSCTLHLPEFVTCSLPCTFI